MIDGLNRFIASSDLLGDFFQPGLILILFGFIILTLPNFRRGRTDSVNAGVVPDGVLGGCVPHRGVTGTLRQAVVIAGPVLTIAAVFIWEAPAADGAGSILLSGAPAADGALSGERLSLIFGIIFSVISLVTAIYNLHTKNRYEQAVEAVYAGSSIGVVFAEHWIGMLVFWEMMAVSSWLIVTSSKTTASRKAGFRYLLIHILGGNLLLAGIVIKLAQGSTVIENLTGTGDAAYWLILTGVAVNAAIPPLNAWLADAYPESTMGGTVYMGSYTTKVGVFCLIKLFAGTELLLYFGVFMAVGGVCMALLENDLRRLLSYHIISQVGYMVASLAIGSEIGVDGASAHAFNHILYKGTLLMCAGAVISATGKRKISQLGGLAKTMPVTSVCFLISSMAIAGFPLLNGFVSKSLIMNAAAQSGAHWAELLLMLASVGTFMSVTLKINYFVFFGKKDEVASDGQGNDKTGKDSVQENACVADERLLPFNMKAAMVIGATACIITGVLPSMVYSLTPYQTDGHPFTVDHVTQYIQLFAAAAIVFVMYIKHIRPSEKITLDTDWFYRKPLKYAFLWLSALVDKIRLTVGNGLGVFFAKANEYLHNPRLLITSRPPAERDCIEDDDVLQKPVGWLVAVNFAILLAAVFYVLIRLG